MEYRRDNPSLRTQRRADPRRRGAAAILAMMFLVIFGALATAMSIVAQGNLSTADSALRIARASAGAETGLQYAINRINHSTAVVKTTAGTIDAGNAPALWNELRDILGVAFGATPYNVVLGADKSITIGPIALGADAATFTIKLTPHPLAGEDYGSSYYQRPPYSAMTPAVTKTAPLDARWIRLRVEATDGTTADPIRRAIQMDFKLEKRIPYAILSRSRVMIGKNVMIEGTIGSRFYDVDLSKGHPVQMDSDFAGLNATLDSKLDQFRNTLITNDMDGDNRLSLANPEEVKGIDNPSQYDYDKDGFITDYDFFLAIYDKDAKGYVTPGDLNTVGNTRLAQLFTLIDASGDPNRPGYGDGKLDADDQYAKIHGQVLVARTLSDWRQHPTHLYYQDVFQGPVTPATGKEPMVFGSPDSNAYQFEAADFKTAAAQLRNLATGGTLTEQYNQQVAQYNPNDPGSPQPVTYTAPLEQVPFDAAHPYDYYKRPVYKNMTFRNVRIPKGSNALFVNCRFIGCTFVETSTSNSYVDPLTGLNYFNQVGMQDDGNGTAKYPGMTTQVDSQSVTDTKPLANNIRFDGCKFEGAIATDVPDEFTHVRNKLAFTGTTVFNVQGSQELSDSEKELYARSTILAPNYSVEMGSFKKPADASETVQLSGTIVAGIIDLRGQVDVNGTILTTFDPRKNTPLVPGETSPQFNTTLGYFASDAGDLEAELPTGGLGRVHVRYNPTQALPDGINGPISVTPSWLTYFEVGPK